MSKFKIEDRCNSYIEVEVYEIEADNEQEAIDLYCGKLAGSIEPIMTYTRGSLKKDEQEIEAVKVAKQV